MKMFFILLALAAALIGCNTLPTPQTKALGILELSLNTNGTATARLETRLSPQAVSLREADVVFGTGTTQVVSSTALAHDYLMATFPVSHASGSSTSLQNLTLYALAKNGNIGSTAIKSIQNFGGVTNSLEQARLAKHLVPVQAITSSGGIDNAKADFQAFTSSEVTAATTISNSLLNAGDTILNYGFAARCTTNCTSNSRQIPTNGTGSITLAIRVPKAAQNTTYGFVMNFVVLDESVSRVTRGVLQQESIANAEARGTLTSATQLAQIGLSQVETSSSYSNIAVPEVQTSSLGASLQALGIGRITAGYGHSCGLTPNGTAYCWGNNGFGQLGSPSASSVPVAVVGGHLFSSISAGTSHTCAITTTGAAYCWGFNSSGQLGNGSVQATSIPTAVLTATSQTELFFSSISAGKVYTCGIAIETINPFTKGLAYCWGNNFAGQLGLGDGFSSTFSFNRPVQVFTPVNDSLLRFSSISAGDAHTCGIARGGTAYCWGRNDQGQLGLGPSNPIFVVSRPAGVVAPVVGGTALVFSSISTGDSHTCGVAVGGAAYCWGGNVSGSLGNGNLNTSSSRPAAVVAPTGGTVLTFSSVDISRLTSCGIAAGGLTYCWGNGFGAAPSALAAPAGGSTLTFSSLETGDFHSCGLTTTGAAYCWGQNSAGQLGNGSTDSSSLPVPVVSTNFGL